MIANLMSGHVIDTIPYEYLPIVLRKMGWQETYRDAKRQAVYRKQFYGEEEEVLVPLQPGFRDYSYVMAALIETVSRAEGITEGQFLESIRNADSDILHIRLSHHLADGGSVPLEVAYQLIGGARELMLAAACVAARPLDLLHELPQEAVDYVSRLEIGEVCPGSVVLSIRSRLDNPVGGSSIDGGPSRYNEAPFARRAFGALADNLSHLCRGITPGTENTSFTALVLGRSWISARLCDAIVQAAIDGTAESLDFEIGWSPIMTIPVGAESRFKLGTDQLAQIAELGRALSPRAGKLAVREEPPNYDADMGDSERKSENTPAVVYMVIETFKNSDPSPIYERLRENGRMMPEGLRYINSWIDVDFNKCYQVMETADRALLDEWIAHWSDLMEFEIHEVVTSAKAAERAGARE